MSFDRYLSTSSSSSSNASPGSSSPETKKRSHAYLTSLMSSTATTLNLISPTATQPLSISAPQQVAPFKPMSLNFKGVPIVTALPDLSELLGQQRSINVFHPPLSSLASVNTDPDSISPPSVMLALPEFDNLDSQEFQFNVLNAMNFDNCRRYRDDKLGVVWFASARDHVYPIERFREFLEKAYDNSKEPEGIRMLLTVDMSILIAQDGKPRADIPSHSQMAGDNAFIVTSGTIFCTYQDHIMMIKTADNQSRFRSSFDSLQFFFIQLMKTTAYKEGQICFDEEIQLNDVTPTARRKYKVKSADLIARCEELAELYRDTLLSPEWLARYAKKFDPVTHAEVPKGVTKEDYQSKIEDPFFCPEEILTIPTAPTPVMPKTPFKKSLPRSAFTQIQPRTSSFDPTLPTGYSNLLTALGAGNKPREEEQVYKKPKL